MGEDVDMAKVKAMISEFRQFAITRWEGKMPGTTWKVPAVNIKNVDHLNLKITLETINLEGTVCGFIVFETPDNQSVKYSIDEITNVERSRNNNSITFVGKVCHIMCFDQVEQVVVLKFSCLERRCQTVLRNMKIKCGLAVDDPEFTSSESDSSDTSEDRQV